VNDAAQGVVEDVPQDVAQDLGFGASAARALLATPPPPPPCLCAVRAEMGAQLDSSVAFGSGCGQALPGVYTRGSTTTTSHQHPLIRAPCTTAPAHTSPLVSNHTRVSHAHARPLYPAALAFVPYGIVLVRVRVRVRVLSSPSSLSTSNRNRGPCGATALRGGSGLPASGSWRKRFPVSAGYGPGAIHAVREGRAGAGKRQRTVGLTGDRSAGSVTGRAEACGRHLRALRGGRRWPWTRCTRERFTRGRPKEASRDRGREYLALGCSTHHRGALRGTPGSTSPQPEPNANGLPSCAPISARAAHRQGGGGGGGEARRARAARAPKPKSCATSCGKSSSATSATSCAASLTCSSLTCSSFTCHLRASVAWFLPCWA